MQDMIYHVGKLMLYEDSGGFSTNPPSGLVIVIKCLKNGKAKLSNGMTVKGNGDTLDKFFWAGLDGFGYKPTGYVDDCVVS